MDFGSSLRPLARRSIVLSLIAVFGAAMATTAAAQCATPDAPDCGQPADPFAPADSSQVKTSRPDVSIPELPAQETQNQYESAPPSWPEDNPELERRGNRANPKAEPAPYLNRRTTTKPEAPTEFQLFVLNSTGKNLKVFGAEFFQGEHAAQFGLLERGPAPPEMIVGPEDELRLRVWGQVNIATNLRVSREGEIYIPKVGAVHVAGLPFGQVSEHIRSAMERVYRNFDLSVEMGQIHSVQIYVTGFARNPGEYAVSALSTLVDAIIVAGGPSSEGSMRHVLLRRKGTVITDFDLYSLLIHGDKTGDAQLQPGDVLFIPPAGAQVAVLGSVRQPAIYELRGDDSVSRMLDAAGGRTAVASDARISLERIEDHSHRRAVDLALDETGLGTNLHDGDIVRVESVASKYQQTVTLRGAVANPGHFAWHEGMRLSQLLPDRESLVKREYWWERTQLGVPGLEFKPLRQSAETLSGAESTSLRPSPGTLPMADETNRPLIVERPAYQTNWNYAVVERLNRETMKTSLLPFNLGKLVLEHDLSTDMPLEPGDVVTIFTESDIRVPAQEQTRYVTLEGEFVHPGVYSVSPTETLRELIRRAGGLTPDAYLYAATFTRQSTRELEAEHLRELSDEMEHQLIRKAMISVGGESNSQAVGLNRELLAQLRNARATGRIVLDFQFDKNGATEFPELHLEDGDRLLVPHRPDTVQVLGAVFNPHAFIYREDGSGDDYLKLAGGPKRDADKKHIYVLRADGTVSDRAGASMFADHLKHVKLRPGDSVIVPEKELRLSSLAEVLAWTQALSQTSVTGMAASSIAK